MSRRALWRRADTVAAGYPLHLQQYVRLLALSLTGSLDLAPKYPWINAKRFCGLDWPVERGFTMRGLVRLKLGVLRSMFLWVFVRLKFLRVVCILTWECDLATCQQNATIETYSNHSIVLGRNFHRQPGKIQQKCSCRWCLRRFQVILWKSGFGVEASRFLQRPF